MYNLDSFWTSMNISLQGKYNQQMRKNISY
jgi:hypothetical protein